MHAHCDWATQGKLQEKLPFVAVPYVIFYDDIFFTYVREMLDTEITPKHVAINRTNKTIYCREWTT